MKIGIVTDSIPAAIEAEKAGATTVIFCQGLLHTGAGVTPSIGAVTTLSSLTTLKVYILLRPVVDTFAPDAISKQVLLSDAEHFASMPCVAGFVFAAHISETREVDIEFARQVVARANGKEVWYHRAYMCLKSEAVGFQQMKDCQLTGVVLSLHGEVTDDKIQYVQERLEQLETIGLQAMITGTIDKLYRHQVAKSLSKFTLSKTLHSWVLTIPLESPFEGALLPWRDWDIGSYLWPDVKTQRLSIDSITPLVSQFVTLESADDSPNSTVAPPPA